MRELEVHDSIVVGLYDQEGLSELGGTLIRRVNEAYMAILIT